MKKNQGKDQAGSSRRVVLTTGYEVELAEKDGLEHLFNAVIGDTARWLSETEELSERGWPLVHQACLNEIHYVAGQLKQAGSAAMDVEFLAEQFGVHWDRVAEKLRESMGDDEK